jgi:CBS domain-containing protein
MRARDIMTANPRAVTSDDTVTTAAQLMRELDVGIIPVVDDSSSMRLRGVITDRDIAVRHVAEGHGNDCRVSAHMSEDKLTTATPEDDVDDVMDRMQRAQVRRIPVVEDGDRLVGIIAQADLAIDVGPGEPAAVAKTVEKISEPAEPRR